MNARYINTVARGCGHMCWRGFDPPRFPISISGLSGIFGERFLSIRVAYNHDAPSAELNSTSAEEM